MPKELHEITKFTSGTITVPDQKDIPDEAASYSINIDSVAEGGKLKGVPSDLWLKSDGTWVTTGMLSSLYSTKLAMINKAGQRDVIRYDPTSNGIHNITDFYDDNSTFAVNDMGDFTSSADEVTMQVHNKEVHMGMGRGSTDVPKWVGYVDHKQFGTAVTAIQDEDAELKAPGSFPEMYNAVTVGSYVYAIQWGGTRIYRFSATAFDSVSSTVFVSTQGLSLVHAGDDIWVYDDNASFGTIYKIDVSAWGTADEIIQSNSISGFISAGAALSTGFEVSDLYDDGTVMWLASWKSGIINQDSDGDFLYNATLLADNSSYTFTNRTPAIDDDSAVVGTFLAQSDFYLYKQCLVGGTFEGVGVVGWLNDTSAIVQTDSNEDGGGITIQKGLILWSVERTYTARAIYDMGVALSGTTDMQIHELINAGADAYTVYGNGAFFQDGDKFMAAKEASADSVTLTIALDVAQAAVAAGADSSTPHDTVPTVQDTETGIEADGLAFAVKSDRLAIYGFEQGGGGGYITLVYNDSTTITSPVYRERSDLRVSFSSSDQGTGTFSSSDTYFWKFSYMYDEYQESPLSFPFSNTPTNVKNIQLTIDLFQTSTLSKRVSHVMIYRSQKAGEIGAATPESFYRLVKKFPLANQFALVSSGWGSSVDFRRGIFVDVKANIGASYEARNLMPETLESSIVNYALSTQINSMHIIGKCYKTEIPDAMNYLFKSKVNNFDQFDWTTDFLRLPTVPTAMASFNGRIYVFDENNTYRINPQGFYVEDTFEGAGCYGSDAVVVTEYGMCYCDKNNVYLHDGKAPKPIASSILTGDSYYSWHNIVQTKEPMVMFDAKRKSFIIFFKSTNSYSGYYFAWSYNLIYNRWDLLSYGASEPKGILHGKNGELFVAQSNGYLAHFMGGSSVDTWEWQSKYMTMGEDTVNKKFYDINVVNGGVAPNVLYGIGSATPSQDPTSESGSSNYKGKVQSAHSKSKTLQIKLVQVGGFSHTVDSVGVLYRRLPKTSGNI